MHCPELTSLFGHETTPAAAPRFAAAYNKPKLEPPVEEPSSSAAAARSAARHVSRGLTDELRPAQLPHRPSSLPPPSPPESLAAAIDRHWLTIDRHAIVLVMAVHIATLARFHFSRSEELVLRGMVASLIAGFVLSTVAPRWYLAGRQAIVVCLRLFNFLAMAFATDAIGMLHPGGPPAAAACGAAGWLAAVGGIMRAIVMLLMPVAWLPGCLGQAMGLQLPPLQHLALQGLSVLLLAWRAPAACTQYLGLQPCAGHVVGAAYKLLQSAISLAAPGSHRRLTAAAEAASDAQQCTAVVWALQASLAFLLPTLYVWRSQLLVAFKYVEGQQHWRRRAEADSALHGSAYAWLCAPVLRAAEFCTGDWTLAVVLAALGGFMAGVLWHIQQNA